MMIFVLFFALFFILYVWKYKYKTKYLDLLSVNGELLKSREGYYLIFNNAQVAIVRSRVNDGKILECNEKFAEMLGYSSRESCLEECISIKHYVDPSLRNSIIKSLNIHGIVDGYESELIRCDGTKIWIRFSAKISSEKKTIDSVCVDITRYKNALQELNKSREELRLIYDASPGHVLVIDSDKKIRKVNRSIVNFLGCLESNIIGFSFGDIFGCVSAKDDPSGCGFSVSCGNCFLQKTINECITTRVSILRKEFSLVVRSAFGVKTYHFLLSVSPIKKQEDGLVLVCLEDVSEMKEYQDKLVESEERFRGLFDQASDAIFVIDNNAKFVDVNLKACKVLGYTREELLTMTIADVDADYSEEDFRECLNFIEIEKKPFLMERRHVCKNGHKIIVEVSASDINLQEGMFIIAIVRDVTDRKNAEEDLKSSEKSYASLYSQFKTLLDAISDPLVLLGVDLQPVWSNSAYNALTGSVATEKRSRGFDIETLVPSVTKCFRYGKAIEEVVTAKDKTVWGIKAFPLLDDDGSHNQTLAIAVDITEKILLREEADRMSRLASLGEMAAGVAHEINNPTSVILLNMPIIKAAFEDARVVLDDYHKRHSRLSLAGIDYSEMSSELPLMIDGVHKSAGRISKIVNDLKGFVRDEGETNFEKLDLNAIVNSSVIFLDNIIRQSTDCFLLKLTPGLPLLHGNKHKLEQVFINLIHNACQALTDRSQAIIVNTMFDAEKDRLILKVYDFGRGIEHGDLSKVADPFFTTRRDSGGTGLGLSVSSRILKEHGAHMYIESELNKGSIFSVFFPLSEKEN